MGTGITLLFTDEEELSLDRTSEANPYRFWVNDDSDGAGDGADSVGDSTAAITADSQDEKIISIRDP